MVTAIKECGYFENNQVLQRIIESKTTLPSTVTIDPSLDQRHPAWAIVINLATK